MKTMIFWTAKRSRKPKMVGLATADCSVLTIADFSKMALDGKGRLHIVTAKTAAAGREVVALFKRGPELFTPPPTMVTNIGDGAIVALGQRACIALAGASEGAKNWDARIRRDGKVKSADTIALGADRSDGVTPSRDDWFGGAFKS